MHAAEIGDNLKETALQKFLSRLAIGSDDQPALCPARFSMYAPTLSGEMCRIKLPAARWVEIIAIVTHVELFQMATSCVVSR